MIQEAHPLKQGLKQTEDVFVRCNIPCYKPWISGCRRNILPDIDDIVDCGYYGI